MNPTPTPRRSDVPTIRTKRKSNVGIFIALFLGSTVLIAIVIVVVWMMVGGNALRVAP
jgi:hypothetical protein